MDIAAKCMASKLRYITLIPNKRIKPSVFQLIRFNPNWIYRTKLKTLKKDVFYFISNNNCRTQHLVWCGLLYHLYAQYTTPRLTCAAIPFVYTIHNTWFDVYWFVLSIQFIWLICLIYYILNRKRFVFLYQILPIS